MRPIDVLTSPWAIVPEKLMEITEIYNSYVRGDKADISAIEAKLGKPLDNTKDENYQVIDGIAVIPIQGVIANKMNLFSRISGGVSAQLTARDVKSAFADESIKGILLDIDSPGGTVDGTQELADIIFAGREIKPILAYSDGMIASAAYWIGSGAHKIYVSSDMVRVGSIGVVTSHVDCSEAEKKLGVKTTEIYAGKHKGLLSQHKPLSKEGKQSVQDQVDYMYSVFVDQVAKHRGVSTEKVLKNMADGKVFIGRQAVGAGLVDGVSTFDQALDRVSAMQSAIEEKKKLRTYNNQLSVISPAH